MRRALKFRDGRAVVGLVYVLGEYAAQSIPK